MPQIEGSLLQKDDFNYVRALDANGNSIKINKSNFVSQNSETLGGKPMREFNYGFSFENTTGNNSWIKLGSFTNVPEGSILIVDIYAGKGWNSRPSQNTYYRVFIKKSWQRESSLNNAFGVLVERNGIKSEIDWGEVKVICTRSSMPYADCDVWINFKSESVRGSYYIKNTRGTWKNMQSSQSGEPSGMSQPIEVKHVAYVEDLQSSIKTIEESIVQE